MIRIVRSKEEDILDDRTRQYLQTRQSEANQFLKGSTSINNAWNAFLKTKARAKISAALDTLSHEKCAYCEQVAAKDIEHFYPKGEFPERMFSWSNFLKGCKNCNNAKREWFPLYGGSPLLIDPYSEEPLDFLRWDFTTGKTIMNPVEPAHTRAKETRDVFSLDQEPIREERRQKFLDVQYLLARVVEENPVGAETKDRLRDHLAANRPWLGIVRCLFRFPGRFQSLISSARQKLPEIDDWTKAWL
ncbi:MAG: retron system putative HNH endonuclease [Pirellulaceae bacterium]|nr:retron system putative HNH endonuclease [Pirellulaceae bacterium]